jgi:hypothetical protein
MNGAPGSSQGVLRTESGIGLDEKGKGLCEECRPDEARRPVDAPDQLMPRGPLLVPIIRE